MKKRDSNIELLRIICILLVIAGHYYYHGGWSEGLSVANTIFLKIFGGGSKLAVNCFVLITGYYGANIHTKRIIPLIRDRWFYSILLTLILICFGVCTLDGKLIVKTLFPLLTCRHNFITVFVMLYFFIPCINYIINALGKVNLEKIIVLGVLFFSLIPSVYPTYANNTYVYIFWMIILFSIGRYIGTYNPKLPWGRMLMLSVIILLILTFMVEPSVNMYPENYWIGMQYSFPLLVASCSLLGAFSELYVPYNKNINSLAASTFAVYLLHDDPNVRSFIWTEVFHNTEYEQCSYLWIHFFISIMIIYFVCVTIDKIYKMTIYKVICKIPTYHVEKVIDKICSLRD